MLKKIIKRVGLVLTILALLFIIRKLSSMEIDFSILLGSCMPVFLVCTLVYAVLVYFLGKPWKSFVSVITGEKIDGREAYYICTKANLMKYIPGNVFQFIGRNELAVIHNLKHKDVACATILDTLCMILAALLVALVFHAKGLVAWLLQYVSLAVLVAGILILCVIGIVFLWVLNKKIAYFQFLFTKKNVVAVVKGTLFFCIFYLGSAAMFIAIIHYVLGFELTMYRIGILVGTWAIGYLMGYVMPGSPGGMGIREMVLCFLLQGMLGTDEVLLTTVLLRVTNIVGEIISFGVAVLLYEGYKKQDDIV